VTETLANNTYQDRCQQKTHSLAFPPEKLTQTRAQNESLALSLLRLRLISLAFFAFAAFCAGFLLSSVLGSSLKRCPLSRRTHASSAAKEANTSRRTQNSSESNLYND